MKTKLIVTTIPVPLYGRYHNRIEAEKIAFTESIVKELGMPENWEKYFKLDFYNDEYVILKENKMYDAISFRRFKMGNMATYQSDLKERLTDYITEGENRKQAAQKEADRVQYFRDLLDPIFDSVLTYGFHALYNSDGVTVFTEDRPNVIISHNGEISEPKFDNWTVGKYSTSIEAAKAFIQRYQPEHDELMAKANEIKALLPAEFFNHIEA